MKHMQLTRIGSKYEINVQFKWHTFKQKKTKKFKRTDGHTDRRTNGRTDKRNDGRSDYVMPQILFGGHKNIYRRVSA